MADLSIPSAATLTGANLATGDLWPVHDVSASAGSKGSKMTTAEAIIGLNLLSGTIYKQATTGAKTYYTTLADAKAGASSGETVFVGPGSYVVTDSILKTGVNWYFENGSSVSKVSTDGYGILDDKGAAITCAIYGAGSFSVTEHASATGNNLATCSVSNASSNVIVYGKDISIAYNGNINVYDLWAVSGISGTLSVVCENITATGDVSLDAVPSGIYWQQASMSVRCKRITGAGSGIQWAPISAGGDLYVRADDISVTNPSTASFPGAAIWLGSAGAASVAWIECQTVNAFGAAGSLSILGADTSFTQKVYVTAQKLFGLAKITSGLWYVSADKISSLKTVDAVCGALFLQTVASSNALTVRWDVKEHNAETFTGLAMLLPDGIVTSRQMEYTGTASSTGITCSGATVTIADALIDTTANGAIDSISVSGGTLLLKDSKVVAEATQVDVNRSSGTVNISGGYGSGTGGRYVTTGTVAYLGPVRDVAFQTLTDAAPVVYDVSKGANAKVTLGASRTINIPTNAPAGMSGTLEIAQDATGSRVATWQSGWTWAGGTDGVLSTAANSIDVLSWWTPDGSTFRASLLKAFAA